MVGGLQIEYKALVDLIPYARNARTHSDEQVAQIASSIREFGWTNPILVDSQNGIIAGHGRIAAARKLGLERVPVISLDGLSDAQRRAYILADNRLALNAGWDAELLGIELADLKELNFDLDLLGFEQDELDALLNPDSGTEGLTDPDQVPEVGQTAVTKPGDLWVLGNHRLLCGDATKVTDIEVLMAGYMADLIVTDPPYNVAYEGKGKAALTIENDSMSSENFYQFLLDAYMSMFAWAKDGAGIYVFHADSEGMNFRRALTNAGFKLAQCCIWLKQSLVMGRQDYHWQHEPVLYGWKPTGKHRWYSDRKQTTVWKFDRPSRNDVHPTMKPIDLIEYPIKNSSRGGDVVLDPFGGSGSTIIACERTGRFGRSTELDPRYCDVIVKRWQEFTGNAAVLESDGRTFAEVESGE